ncbi:MAG: hypothetical protein LJE64_10645 [Desulfofustis sp.]|nr:hypothetical protein [Desulfofustis sp.]
MRPAQFLFMAFSLFFFGCSSIGPGTVHHDRFDYNNALSVSWKEQTLLNIVRLRYGDMPIFLEVASIVSGYSLEGTVNLTGNVSSEDTVQGDYLSLGTGGKFTDRPTITYAPIKGDKFHKNFMTPVPPKLILFLIESGWPTEIVLRLTIDSVNGLRGRSVFMINPRQGNQDFYRVLHLISQIQESGTMAFRIIKGENSQEMTVIFFYKDDMPEEIIGSRKELARLLEIDEQLDQIAVTYGLLPKSKNELALMTRSMLQMLIALSTTIEVPESHVTEHLTYPIRYQPGEEEAKLGKLMRIHSSTEQPDRAFVSVKHLDHWFWIDESDFASKRTLSFVMLLFSMMEGGESEGLPLVTIPAG